MDEHTASLAMVVVAVVIFAITVGFCVKDELCWRKEAERMGLKNPPWWS